jgi:hypothetical protein
MANRRWRRRVCMGLRAVLVNRRQWLRKVLWMMMPMCRRNLPRGRMYKHVGRRRRRRVIKLSTQGSRMVVVCSCVDIHSCIASCRPTKRMRLRRVGPKMLWSIEIIRIITQGRNPISGLVEFHGIRMITQLSVTNTTRCYALRVMMNVSIVIAMA